MATATASANTANASFTVQTAVSGFNWKSANDAPWLVVDSGPLGVGNGTVQFSVAANNTGAARAGNTTIAGQAFTVRQTADSSIPCNVSGDAITSVADLQMILDEALGSTRAVSDLNGDGVVNVVDFQKVIESIFGLGCQLNGATPTDVSEPWTRAESTTRPSCRGALRVSGATKRASKA